MIEIIEIKREYIDDLLDPINNKENYDLDSLVETLYSGYLHNIKQLVKLKGHKIEMVPFKEIPFIEINKEWSIMNDVYLKNTENDRAELGRSIVQHGTYWPIIVLQAENQPDQLIDGGHRYHSLNMLVKSGEITSIDLPVLYISEDLGEVEKKEYLLVRPDIVKPGIINLYKKYYAEMLSKKECSIHNDIFMKVKAPYGYLSAAMISMVTRNLFVEKTNRDGEFYKPKIELNNKDEMRRYFYD